MVHEQRHHFIWGSSRAKIKYSMCIKALARAASSSRLVKPLLSLSHLHINFLYDHPPV